VLHLPCEASGEDDQSMQIVLTINDIQQSVTKPHCPSAPDFRCMKFPRALWLFPVDLLAFVREADTHIL